MGQADHEGSNSTTSSNVISLADFIGKRLEKRLPILQASGIELEAAPFQKLTDIIKWSIILVEDAADILSGKRRDCYAINQKSLADRSAARLYRCGKQLKLAVKEAEKLKRRLRKAKKRAKHKTD